MSVPSSSNLNLEPQNLHKLVTITETPTAPRPPAARPQRRPRRRSRSSGWRPRGARARSCSCRGGRRGAGPAWPGCRLPTTQKKRTGAPGWPRSGGRRPRTAGTGSWSRGRAGRAGAGRRRRGGAWGRRGGSGHRRGSYGRGGREEEGLVVSWVFFDMEAHFGPFDVCVHGVS